MLTVVAAVPADRRQIWGVSRSPSSPWSHISFIFFFKIRNIAGLCPSIINKFEADDAGIQYNNFA
jgi:hypothetical protein